MIDQQTLFESMMSGNAAHAYIIEGPGDRERKAFTRKLVQALLCTAEGREGGRPCGICPACRKIAEGTHEDVIEMEQSGKLGYKVGDAAKMMERLTLRPYGDRNVGIVDNAGLLSETVQNKLLKTLEEPYPGTVVFLGTSNRESLLPTVRSRCVLIRMEDEEDRNEEDEEKKAAAELTALCTKGCFFHEYRSFADKNIKTREAAYAFLDAIESAKHRDMLESTSVTETEDRADDIKAIETARMDIARGMGHKQALRRLFLEMKRR